MRCKIWLFTARGKARLYVKSTPAFFPSHKSLFGPDVKVAVACADGSASVSRLHALSLDTLREWTEPRLKPGQRYVGLAASSAYAKFSPSHVVTTQYGPVLNCSFSARGVYSCTSNGALRLTPLSCNPDAEPDQPRTAVLPMRLCAWHLAPDGTTFTYGGDEVELSVWDVEAAFAPKQQPSPPLQSESSRKRKRHSEMLLSGELWRAKNVGIFVWDDNSSCCGGQSPCAHG